MGRDSRRCLLVALLVLTIAGVSSNLTPPPATNRPPHIIFIVADDLGWNDVGWHNPDMYTPNLDSLARDGVILDSSYVQRLCTPSRNCFMSGYYPYHTGLQDQAIGYTKPWGMPLNITTLPQRLKALNYTTHMVGKWHLGFCKWDYTPTYRGFDSYMGLYAGGQDYFTNESGNAYDFRWNTSVHDTVKGEYSTHVIARHAIDLIKTIDPEEDSLYLYLPFQAVHGPLQVPRQYEDIPQYRDIQNPERRTHCGMVSALDEAVGNITDALRKRGYMNNALIVFITDNGGPVQIGANNLPLRGSKGTLWEGGTRGVTFVYSETLLKKTKYINTELIHAVDWYPTLLTLAGGTPDPALDGVNQWPMISEGEASARTEFVYNIDEVTQRSALRDGKYKLMEGRDQGHRACWYPVPTGPRDVIDVNDITCLRRFPQYQLFDIEADPTEHYNIADQHPDIVEDMIRKLEKYRESLVPARLGRRQDFPKPDIVVQTGIWSPGWC